MYFKRLRLPFAKSWFQPALADLCKNQGDKIYPLIHIMNQVVYCEDLRGSPREQNALAHFGEI
jgi:hypothetical protein